MAALKIKIMLPSLSLSITPQSVAVCRHPHTICTILYDVHHRYTHLLHIAEGTCVGIVDTHFMEGAHPYAVLAVTADGVGCRINMLSVLIVERRHMSHCQRVHIHDIHSLRIGAHIKKITLQIQGMHIVLYSPCGQPHLDE